MKFIQENFLYALIPAALVLFFAAFAAAWRRRRALSALLGEGGYENALRLSRGRRFAKWSCVLIALLLLLLAAARPYWDEEILPSQSRGRDVVVLFDVSRSMNAADPAPSRLAHAKQLLRELVERSPGDRFAIVAFAGSAYTLCPLTADRGALLEYLEELSPSLAPYGGTNLELALQQMKKAFFAAEGAQRTVILLTDGEELTGSGVRFIADLKSQKIPLVVIGLGDPVAGAPVPAENGALLRNPAGQVVTSRLNEKLLRELAEKSGGVYIHSTAVDPGLRAVENVLNKAAASNSQRTFAKTRPVERFPILLGGAALFLLIALALSEYGTGRRCRVVLPILIGFFGATLSGAAEAAPQDPVLRYNEARRSQLDGDETKAVPLYESVIEEATGRPELRSRSFYNLGIGRHQAGRAALPSAQKLLGAQQMEGALKELAKGKEALDLAEAFYGRALASGGTPGKDVRETLLQLHADRRALEELKKQIEELKKQQQQAQQDAQKAQDQNKKDQNQPQDQKRQNQKDQNQPQNRQEKQQQDQRRQSAREAAQKAQQSAADLQKKAAALNQQKLADDARSARQELQKAVEKLDQRKKQEAQRHLDEAVKKLGAPEPSPQEKEKNAGGSPKREKPQNRPQEPQQQPSSEKSDQEKSAAARLDSLNDEARSLRNEIRRGRERRQIQVERDW